MAMTVNGMIAKTNDETEWSDEDEKSYFAKAREVGNIITGSRTYPLYQEKNFEEMGNPFVVVLTSKNSGVKSEKLAYANSPQEALEILEKQGFEKALVAGGGKTNRSFLKENLIDEIYLDVEPMIYGEGISLFNSTNSKLDLELIGQKMLNKNTIQLHYKVIK